MTETQLDENKIPQKAENKTRPSQLGESHLSLARQSLQQSVQRFMGLKSPIGSKINPELQAKLQAQLAILESNLDKLNHNIIRIAAFGLVSRGKSAVLNAILGQKFFQTGPLNGVTQWPRAVRWTVADLGETSPEGGATTVESEEKSAKNKVQIELIDTPGLDEIGGAIRGEMAKEVSQQADLILFIVSGDLTNTEQEALLELRKAGKPIILVFNKIDLYLEKERSTIYENLQKLGQVPVQDDPDQSSVTVWEVVMVAAAPAPQSVRVEWPDGRINYEWETMPANIKPLQEKILEILNREGRSLLALNALKQSRNAEVTLAHQMIKLKQGEAEDLIWQFAKYKALAIAINPIAILDIISASVVDLLLIRSLSELYGLPITNYEANQIWRAIIASSGGIILGEIGSSIVLGIGKTSIGLLTGFSSYLGIALTQGSLAAYGTYAVGRAAQVYLEKGCTWGPDGQDTVIQEILKQVNKDTFIQRLQKEIM